MLKNKENFQLALKFNNDKTFQNELRKRVDARLRSIGRPQRDNWQMYFKTAIILASFAIAYYLLVFWAKNVWQALPLSIILGFAVAGIGFDIQHDGGHNAYSKHNWINKIMALTIDIIGGSSYIWWWKHVAIHHRYVNITGYDTDIEVGLFGRMSPYQKRLPWHRWQHIYLWPLYGLLAIKWHLFDDFKTVLNGKFAQITIPRPKGVDLLTFIAGKTVFLSLAFFIPLLHHSFLVVLAFYSIAAIVLGMLMSLIFQLPHVVEEAEFPLPDKKTGIMPKPWAVHQASVTLNFSTKNPILTWALGGLNFHREHHLFPIICHVNYPSIAKIVYDTCNEFGVSCMEHRSFLSGVGSHFRWLKKMGKIEMSQT